jgi:hypothetical protein
MKKSSKLGFIDVSINDVREALESAAERVQAATGKFKPGIEKATDWTVNGYHTLEDATTTSLELGRKGALAVADAVRDPDEILSLVKAKARKAKIAVADVYEQRSEHLGKAKVAMKQHRRRLEHAARNPKETAELAAVSAKGFVRGGADALTSVGGHFSVGRKDLMRLNSLLERQSREYAALTGMTLRGQAELGLGSDYLDALLVGGAVLNDSLARRIPADILAAYAAQYPGLADQESFREHVRSLSDGQIAGFVAGVKGKLFEIMYVDYLNEGVVEPGYHAGLAKSATQAGWDIQVTGPDAHIVKLIQAKATDSVAYVQAALMRYPDIPVVTPSEVHGALVMKGYSERVIDSDISHGDLKKDMSDGVDAANDEFNAATILLSLSILAFTSYGKDGLSIYEESRGFGARAGTYLISYFAGMTADLISTGIPFVGVAISAGTRVVVGTGRNKIVRRDSLQALTESNETLLSRYRRQRGPLDT